jgi:uncharacterized protein (DUF433 family)
MIYLSQPITGFINLNRQLFSGRVTILELLSSGMTVDELLADYPDLVKEDFLACIEYAAKLTQIKSIYRIAS